MNKIIVCVAALCLIAFVSTKIQLVGAKENITSLNLVQDSSETPAFGFQKVIKLIINDKSELVFTNQDTVGNFVNNSHIDGEIMIISPKPETAIIPFLEIKLEVITKKQVQITEDIPFGENVTYVNTLPKGQKQVTKPGVTGKKIVTKEQQYKDEALVGEKVLSEYIMEDPVAAEVNVGTKKIYYRYMLPNGQVIQYTRSLYVWATSYDYRCSGCNHYTATGAWLTKGIVAVDPRVIALHTHMYVPGYGYGQAEDTGGAIKGNRIDLGYDDVRYGDWSARWVTIYLLD